MAPLPTYTPDVDTSSCGSDMWQYLGRDEASWPLASVCTPAAVAACCRQALNRPLPSPCPLAGLHRRPVAGAPELAALPAAPPCHAAGGARPGAGVGVVCFHGRRSGALLLGLSSRTCARAVAGAVLSLPAMHHGRPTDQTAPATNPSPLAWQGLYVTFAQPAGAPVISGYASELMVPFTLTSFALSLLMLFRTNSRRAELGELAPGGPACLLPIEACSSRRSGGGADTAAPAPIPPKTSLQLRPLLGGSGLVWHRLWRHPAHDPHGGRLLVGCCTGEEELSIKAGMHSLRQAEAAPVPCAPTRCCSRSPTWAATRPSCCPPSFAGLRH